MQQLIQNTIRKSVLSLLWECASRALNQNRALVEASISSPGNLTIFSCYATCSANALFPHTFSSWEKWTFFPSQPNYCSSKLEKKNPDTMTFFLENVIMKQVVCRGKNNIQCVLDCRYVRIQTGHTSLFLSLCSPQTGTLELQPWDMDRNAGLLMGAERRSLSEKLYCGHCKVPISLATFVHTDQWRENCSVFG